MFHICLSWGVRAPSEVWHRGKAWAQCRLSRLPQGCGMLPTSRIGGIVTFRLLNDGIDLTAGVCFYCYITIQQPQGPVSWCGTGFRTGYGYLPVGPCSTRFPPTTFASTGSYQGCIYCCIANTQNNFIFVMAPICTVFIDNERVAHY